MGLGIGRVEVGRFLEAGHGLPEILAVEAAPEESAAEVRLVGVEARGVTTAATRSGRGARLEARSKRPHHPLGDRILDGEQVRERHVEAVGPRWQFVGTGQEADGDPQALAVALERPFKHGVHAELAGGRPRVDGVLGIPQYGAEGPHEQSRQGDQPVDQRVRHPQAEVPLGRSERAQRQHRQREPPGGSHGPHRSAEAVASPGHCLHPIRAVLPQAQHSPQGRDGHAQVRLLDHGIRPHAANERGLRDDVALLLEQGFEEPGRLRSQGDHLRAAPEDVGLGVEDEGTKGEAACGPHEGDASRPVGHWPVNFGKPLEILEKPFETRPPRGPRLKAREGTP